MFSTAKLYLGIAVTATISFLLAMIKYKSDKLEETRVKLADAKQAIRTARIQKEVNEEISKNYYNELKTIGDKYDLEEKELYLKPDAPLSDSLLELLRNKQGVGGNTNTSPK